MKKLRNEFRSLRIIGANSVVPAAVRRGRRLWRTPQLLARGFSLLCAGDEPFRRSRVSL